MKYGRTYRTKLCEIDAITMAVYGPTIADAIATRSLNPIKAVAASDFVEQRIGSGTGKARKAGRKFGKVLRRAHGLEESFITLRASLREADEDFVNPQIKNLRKFEQSMQRDPTYKAAGQIPFVGAGVQNKLERKRAGRAVTAANKAQLASMEKTQADKLNQIKAQNQAFIS